MARVTKGRKISKTKGKKARKNLGKMRKHSKMEKC